MSEQVASHEVPIRSAALRVYLAIPENGLSQSRGVAIATSAAEIASTPRCSVFLGQA